MRDDDCIAAALNVVGLVSLSKDGGRLHCNAIRCRKQADTC